jgi:hypothetical protein
MNTADTAAELWRLFYGIRSVQRAKTASPLATSATAEEIAFLDGLDVAVDVLATKGAELADALREVLVREVAP